MKKFLLSLAALALNAGAFAQSASFISNVTFNVAGQTQVYDGEEAIEDSFNVPSTTAVVNIDFVGYNASYVETNGITPMLMWTTGTGFAISEPEYEFLDPADEHFTFTLTGNWGNPAMGDYYANVMVCFFDAEYGIYRWSRR